MKTEARQADLRYCCVCVCMFVSRALLCMGTWFAWLRPCIASDNAECACISVPLAIWGDEVAPRHARRARPGEWMAAACVYIRVSHALLLIGKMARMHVLAASADTERACITAPPAILGDEVAPRHA